MTSCLGPSPTHARDTVYTNQPVQRWCGSMPQQLIHDTCCGNPIERRHHCHFNFLISHIRWNKETISVAHHQRVGVVASHEGFLLASAVCTKGYHGKKMVWRWYQSMLQQAIRDTCCSNVTPIERRHFYFFVTFFSFITSARNESPGWSTDRFTDCNARRPAVAKNKYNAVKPSACAVGWMGFQHGFPWCPTRQ